jgi:hypothetical protein
VGGTLNVTGSTSLTNPVINNIKMGYTTTATAAGTTTLTVTSNYRQFFTGSTPQTIVLPVTSTLVTGMAYEIENNSTGLLTVNSSGGNLVGTIPAGVCAHAVCIGTTLTTAADWDWDYISTTTITGTGANVLGTSPTIATPTITGDATISGLTVGKGGGAVATNTAVGTSTLNANTSGATNVAIGYQALLANTTGGDNVAVGKGTLVTHTGGSRNTAIGSAALNLNTVSDNTAIGFNSLNGNTSGGSNVAVGSGALSVNTTASQNTAVGYQAGYSFASTGTAAVTAFGYQAAYTINSADPRITAIGYQALYTNNGGGTYENTAVGYSAARLTTTGSSLVAMGNKSLYANTTGSSNVAVGYQALTANTTASRQAALGYRALTASNGQGNVGVGYGAGKDVTSGTDNVCIGDLAGSSQGSLTTGAGNIFIGTSAGANIASAGTAANQISIGYNVPCIGDNYFTFGKNTGADRVYNQFTANATWTRSSDERLKTQITENTNCGLEFITDLRTVTYKWKAGADIDETLADYNPEEKEPEYKEKMYGFIAQEVKSAMDKNGITDFAGWAVTPDEQGAIQGVSYEMFVIPLIKAVQELKSIVDAQAAEIAELKAKVGI